MLMISHVLNVESTVSIDCHHCCMSRTCVDDEERKFHLLLLVGSGGRLGKAKRNP